MSHVQASKNNSRLLKIVLFFTLSFTAIEFIGGYISNSLALLADASHMLSDSVALILSLAALKIASYPASKIKTFGFYRIEIIAALVNGIILGGVALSITIEALKRIQTNQPIDASVMLWIASIGLLVNLISALILAKASHDNLNIKGAFFHVVADGLASVGTVLASLFIIFLQWNFMDAAISIVISIIIMVSAVKLIKDTLNVFLESAPPHINVDKVQARIESHPKVSSIHDLHIWMLTPKQPILTVHVVTENPDSGSILIDLMKILKDEFGLSHNTIQIERDDCSYRCF